MVLKVIGILWNGIHIKEITVVVVWVILIERSVDILQKLVSLFGNSLGAVLVTEGIGDGLQTRLCEFDSHPALKNLIMKKRSQYVTKYI